MPELPDVETYKRYLDSTSLNKKIDQVSEINKKILKNTSKKKLKESLIKTKFINTERHGKYLFLLNSKKIWTVVHFGMTGFVKYFKDLEDKPSHTRLLFHFDNGYYLAFDNQRLLGKIELTKNQEEYIRSKNLGIDALHVSFDVFQDLFQAKRGMIKSALMDQSVIAGIGNIYADEILFQSEIYPKTKVNQLDTDDLKNMYDNMQEIFDIAINTKVNTNDFPDTYIIPNRTKNGVCPKDGEKLKTIKVNGRTTYFCPIHQKK